MPKLETRDWVAFVVLAMVMIGGLFGRIHGLPDWMQDALKTAFALVVAYYFAASPARPAPPAPPPVIDPATPPKGDGQ